MKQGAWKTSEVLTKGIYPLLSEKCGVVNSPASKAHAHQSPHNRELKQLSKKKKQLKRAFREAKKDSAPKDIMADLAKQYYQAVRLHSKLAEARCKCEEWKNAKTIRKQCMQNFCSSLPVYSTGKITPVTHSQLAQPRMHNRFLTKYIHLSSTLSHSHNGSQLPQTLNSPFNVKRSRGKK